jgi:hypothetical protein
VDNLACDSAKELRLGRMSRTLEEGQDLFAVLADPLAFSCRQVRFPGGPAIVFADVPELPEDLFNEEMDAERWDGLS